MMTKEYKAGLDLSARELARQRRMESVMAQASQLEPPKSPFISVTKRISSGEARLISFITTTLQSDSL